MIDWSTYILFVHRVVNIETGTITYLSESINLKKAKHENLWGTILLELNFQITVKLSKTFLFQGRHITNPSFIAHPLYFKMQLIRLYIVICFHPKSLQFVHFNMIDRFFYT